MESIVIHSNDQKARTKSVLDMILTETPHHSDRRADIDRLQVIILAGSCSCSCATDEADSFGVLVENAI